MIFHLDCYASLPGFYVTILVFSILFLCGALAMACAELFHLIGYEPENENYAARPGFQKLSRWSRRVFIDLLAFKNSVLMCRTIALFMVCATITVIAVFQADYCFGFSLSAGQRTTLTHVAFLACCVLSYTVIWNVSVLTIVHIKVAMFGKVAFALAWTVTTLVFLLLITEIASRFSHDEPCEVLCSSRVFDVFDFILFAFGVILQATTSVFASAYALYATQPTFPWTDMLPLALQTVGRIACISGLSACVRWVGSIEVRSYDRSTISWSSIPSQDLSWHLTAIAFSAFILVDSGYWVYQHRNRHRDIIELCEQADKSRYFYNRPHPSDLTTAKADSLLQQRRILEARTGPEQIAIQATMTSIEMKEATRESISAAATLSGTDPLDG